MNSSVSDSGSVQEPSPPPVVKRTRLIDINEWITCYLCGGYLIDAMTLIECQTLHSFCKSCIFKYLKEIEMNGMMPVCPTCDEPLNESKPHLSMRQDTKLQDIVYKLVPGLYKREMERRREFYMKLGSVDPKGDARNDSLFYVPHDKISLSLEYHLSPSTDTDSSFSSSSHINNHGANKRKVDSAGNSGVELSPERRFLSCQAGMPVYLLKKFIVQKYSLDRSYQVHLMYNNHSLTDDLTLMDVIYIYSWCRNDPMRFYYTIERSNKKLKSGSVVSPVSIRCEESAEEGSKSPSEKEVEERGKDPCLEKKTSIVVSPLSTSCSSDCSVSSVSPRSGKHHHKHHHKKSKERNSGKERERNSGKERERNSGKEREKSSGKEKEPKATFHAVPTSRGVTIKKDVVSPQSSPTLKVALVQPTSSSPSVVTSVTSITSTTACDVSSTTTVTMAMDSFEPSNSSATKLTLSNPPTKAPPTKIPPTKIPPTKIPPTKIPPTKIPSTKAPFSKTPPSAKVPVARPSTKISLPKPPVSKPMTLPKPPVSKPKVPVTKPAITKPNQVKSPLTGSYPPIKYPTIRYPSMTSLSTPKNTSSTRPSSVKMDSVVSGVKFDPVVSGVKFDPVASGGKSASSFPVITPSTNRGGNFPSPFSPESPSLPPTPSSLSSLNLPSTPSSLSSLNLPSTPSSLSSLKMLNGILPSPFKSGGMTHLSDARIQSKNSPVTLPGGTNHPPSISSPPVTSSSPSLVTSAKPVNGMLPSPYLKTVDQPRFSSSPIQKSSSPIQKSSSPTTVNQGSMNLIVPSVSSALSLTIPSLPPTTSSLSALKAVSGVLPSPSSSPSSSSDLKPLSSDLKPLSSDLKPLSSDLKASSPPSSSPDLNKPRSNHSIRDIIGDSYPSKVSGNCSFSSMSGSIPSMSGSIPSMSGSIRPFAYRTVTGGPPCHVAPPLTSHIPCRPVATRLVSASRTAPHSPASLTPSSFMSSTCKNRPSLDQVLNRLKFLGSTNSTM